MVSNVNGIDNSQDRYKEEPRATTETETSRIVSLSEIHALRLKQNE